MSTIIQRREAAAGFSRAQALVVGLMFGLSVMSYFDRTIMSIAGPEIMKQFRLTETELGTIYSAFLLTYALLMIPGGSLADRLGPRLVLGFMALGSAVFTALTALGGRPGLGAFIGIVHENDVASTAEDEHALAARIAIAHRFDQRRIVRRGDEARCVSTDLERSEAR
jgi:sugar phosphate permease